MHLREGTLAPAFAAGDSAGNRLIHIVVGYQVKVLIPPVVEPLSTAEIGLVRLGSIKERLGRLAPISGSKRQFREVPPTTGASSRSVARGCLPAKTQLIASFERGYATRGSNRWRGRLGRSF